MKRNLDPGRITNAHDGTVGTLVQPSVTTNREGLADAARMLLMYFSEKAHAWFTESRTPNIWLDEIR